MTDTIVRNSSPTANVEGIVFVMSDYASGYDVEHIHHKQLHGTGVNIVYRPVRERSGSLSVGFTSAAAAHAAIALLRTEHTFTLTADVSEVSMTFAVRPGRLEPVPEPGIPGWIVRIPFQDVTE